MKKLYLIPGIFMLVMGVSAQGFAAAAAKPTTHPCKPIKEACIKAGYIKGGHSAGKGLLVDCVMPVANNKKTLDKMTFDPAVLQACQTSLVEKMKLMKKQ